MDQRNICRLRLFERRFGAIDIARSERGAQFPDHNDLNFARKGVGLFRFDCQGEYVVRSVVRVIRRKPIIILHFQLDGVGLDFTNCVLNPKSGLADIRYTPQGRRISNPQ
jgi:hypothetical protein